MPTFLCSFRVVQATACTMSLLGVLVDKELAVRSKLKRLHDSQVRVTSWSCLTPELSAHLKRNVDDIALRGGVTLPRVLAQPMLTRTASKSTVANIFNILLQISQKAATHSTRAIATSALGILRAVSASLGDGTSSRWESSPRQHLARTQSRSCPWHLRTMALAIALARSIRPGSDSGLPITHPQVWRPCCVRKRSSSQHEWRSEICLDAWLTLGYLPTRRRLACSLLCSRTAPWGSSACVQAIAHTLVA